MCRNNLFLARRSGIVEDQRGLIEAVSSVTVDVLGVGADHAVIEVEGVMIRPEADHGIVELALLLERCQQSRQRLVEFHGLADVALQFDRVIRMDLVDLLQIVVAVIGTFVIRPVHGRGDDEGEEFIRMDEIRDRLFHQDVVRLPALNDRDVEVFDILIDIDAVGFMQFGAVIELVVPVVEREGIVTGTLE